MLALASTRKGREVACRVLAEQAPAPNSMLVAFSTMLAALRWPPTENHKKLYLCSCPPPQASS